MGRVRKMVTALATIAVLLTAATAANATTAAQVITSAGPLSHIWIGNDLDCQVQYGSLAAYEFFSPSSAPGDCGTFLFVPSSSGTPSLYGPDFSTQNAAVPFEVGSNNYLQFTPVSQPAATGAGTAQNPYTLTTTVTASSGITLTEVDSYVVGQNQYGTSITISNDGTDTFTGKLFHAADCYLQGSDTGYGAVFNNNSPACTQNANNSPSGLYEAFEPTTNGSPDSVYMEGNYGDVFGVIAGQTEGNPVDFNNSCECLGASDGNGGYEPEDNGAGIEWPSVSVPTRGSATYTFQTDLFGSPVSNASAGPGITGTATIGGTLGETHGAYTPTPTGYTYQWEDCDSAGNNCSPILNATGATYTVGTNDVGHSLRVIETAVNSAGSGDSLTSSATGVVPKAAVTISTKQASGSSSGTSLSVPAGTTGETDRATLSGPAVSVADGTITYTLYSKSSCAQSSAVVQGTTLAFADGNVPTSDPVTAVLKPGRYYWRAVYSGDLYNAAASSTCGAETLRVTPGTTVLKTATANANAIKLSAGCAVVPCKLTIKIVVTERVAVTSNALALKTAKKKRYKNKAVTIAYDSTTIRHVKKVHNQVSGVALDAKLTKQGRNYLTAKRRRHIRHVRMTLKITEKVKTTTLATTSSLNVALDAPAKA